MNDEIAHIPEGVGGQGHALAAAGARHQGVALHVDVGHGEVSVVISGQLPRHGGVQLGLVFALLHHRHQAQTVFHHAVQRHIDLIRFGSRSFHAQRAVTAEYVLLVHGGVAAPVVEVNQRPAAIRHHQIAFVLRPGRAHEGQQGNGHDGQLFFFGGGFLDFLRVLRQRPQVFPNLLAEDGRLQAVLFQHVAHGNQEALLGEEVTDLNAVFNFLPGEIAIFDGPGIAVYLVGHIGGIVIGNDQVALPVDLVHTGSDFVLVNVRRGGAPFRVGLRVLQHDLAFLGVIAQGKPFVFRHVFPFAQSGGGQKQTQRNDQRR